ncbi:hypothetical protein KP509_04G009500 [Ceratopteris richardii]|uniref:Uncharacterized protein n=1 Tax=Ceratopteris richardii TaxID=49495 RepID=A0A8T2UXU9_CERRI|nr:hypothetical protein KP509_04G009500 [Ceratopteris richardii]
MPRKAGGEWEYVEKVKSLPKGNWTVKCKFCSHSWDGGANCIRAHILGLKGYGVHKCNSAPEYIKDACKKMQGKGSQESGTPFGMHSHEESHAYTPMGSIGETSDVGNEEYAMPCGESSSMHGMKRAKASQGPLQKAWESQARDEATKALRRSPYFLDIVNAIGHGGASLKPPSYHNLRTRQLYDEVMCTKNDLLQMREKWKQFGCSILCDGWSDTKNRPIINIMVSCIYGTMFLKSIDTSCQIKSGEYIFEVLRDAIMDVGPSNVVQVSRMASHILHRCTCHCLDLLFEDIGALAWVKPVLTQVMKIVTFVTMKPSILALFRKFSAKDLLKPAQTRFAYMFIMLSNLLDERVAFFWGTYTQNLQALALRILSQGTCASPCERNWSTFSLIHTKRRSKLLPKNTEKLVYIHTNLRLAMKIKEKGFEMQEATLEMIEKEQDDERLLQMQKSVEDEEIPLNSITSITERYVHGDEGPSSTHHGDDDDDDDANIGIDDDEEEEEEEEADD